MFLLESLLLIKSVLGFQCLRPLSRVGMRMIPFWLCLLKAVVCTLVSFHFVASIKNAKGKKNPKNGVEFECKYFLSRLRFCAKRQIDDKKNHFKISRDSLLLRKKEFQPLVSSEEPQRHLVVRHKSAYVRIDL